MSGIGNTVFRDSPPDTEADQLQLRLGRTLSDAHILWSSLSGHCAAAIVNHGPLLISLFLTGLVGSATHCSAMCSPFVVMQVTERLKEQAPGPGGDLRRLVGAALLPYQLGRMTTYMTLGAILALPLGSTFVTQELWWVTPVVLAAVAATLTLQALPRLARRRLSPSRTAYTASPAPHSFVENAAIQKPVMSVGSWIAKSVKPLFGRPTGLRGYRLGMLLGFLPCGLLYAALALAATGREPLVAAFGMFAFTVGTLPLSWAIGLGSTLVAGRFKVVFRQAVPVLTIANVILVLALAYYSVLVA